MKKLSLKLDALVVESFAIDRGSVVGMDTSAPTDCGECDAENSRRNYCTPPNTQPPYRSCALTVCDTCECTGYTCYANDPTNCGSCGGCQTDLTCTPTCDSLVFTCLC